MTAIVMTVYFITSLMTGLLAGQFVHAGRSGFSDCLERPMEGMGTAHFD